MSTKIKSPYTLFSETDKSQFTVAPEVSDFVVIGRTPKGRYFVPTNVSNYNQYIKYFGNASRDEYTGLTVKETLIDADNITVVSIGGTEDYTVDPVFNLNASGSGNVERTFAQIFLSKKGIAEGVTSASIAGDGELGSFQIQFFSGSTQLTDYTFSGSLYVDDINSIVKKDNPLSNDDLFYTKYYYNLGADGVNSGSLDQEASASDPIYLESSSNTTFSGYDEGETPWVVSQTISNSNTRLFRFETLSHGDSANRDVKISIVNVRDKSELSDPEAEYGLFDVLVRAYNDEDDEIQVLESFNNLTMDPESSNYIARRIGDLKREYNTISGQVEENGMYENRSEYVRVVMASTNPIKEAVPFGFESYQQPATFFDGAVPAFIKYPVSGSGNYSGVDFDTLTRKYVDSLHAELPKSTSDFFNTGSAASTFVLSSSLTATPQDDRKFSFGFQGGTSGINMATESLVGLSASVSNTFGLDFTDTSSNGYLAYKKAIDVISDKEVIRFKTLSMAGLTLKQHGNVYNYAHNMAVNKTRGEIIVVNDPTEPNSNATTNVSDIETTLDGAFDTSHGASFAPWFWYNDGELGRVLVPQGALILRTLAYNDKVSAPWYGAFGFERGIQGGARPYTRYNIKLRDKLHDARVNSIVQFVGEPTPLVMNNKTLQRKDSALSFLNVRRLLNEAKIEFDIISRKYYGRPYTPATRTELAEEINAYLTAVQNDNGLARFEAIFDESVNTQEYQDQAIIRGVVYLEPIKSTQGIEIGFVVGNSGTTFQENG